MDLGTGFLGILNRSSFANQKDSTLFLKVLADLKLDISFDVVLAVDI